MHTNTDTNIHIYIYTAPTLCTHEPHVMRKEEELFPLLLMMTYVHTYTHTNIHTYMHTCKETHESHVMRKEEQRPAFTRRAHNAERVGSVATCVAQSDHIVRCSCTRVISFDLFVFISVAKGFYCSCVCACAYACVFSRCVRESCMSANVRVHVNQDIHTYSHAPLQYVCMYIRV
jgi:hypothetical protein